MLRRAALGVLLALALPTPALANGDPASDVLVPPDVRVYMTNGARDGDLESRIQQTATEVSDAGLPIKVAIIGNKTDLGAVPQLWAQPQVYARFLGAELRFLYKDTLLTVMPQGFGINGPFPVQRAVVALAGIDPRVDTTPEGLTESADRALRALAKADGRTLPSSGGTGGIPLQFIAAAVMVVAGIGGALLILRLGEPAAKTGDERAEKAGDVPAA